MPDDRGAHIATTHHGLARSPHWEATKKKFLADNAHCAACGPNGPTKSLQVHHRQPFHYCVLAGRPDLELDPRNLVTLCESEGKDASADHHLLLGHLDDFQSYNPSVWEHATETYHAHTKEQIQADAAYQAMLKQRPKTWPEMSDAERAAFRAHLDATYPLQK
jgi:hypothetical protein